MAGLVRAGAPLDDLLACGNASHAGWPAHSRKALVVAEIAAGTMSVTRMKTLIALAADEDPRVRATAIAAMVGTSDSRLLGRAAPYVVGALRDSAPVVVGGVAEALAETVKAGRALEPAYARALLERAGAERLDPELRDTLVSTLVAAKVDGTEELCRAALNDVNRTVRSNAAKCVTTLSGMTTRAGHARSPQAMPPGDPATVLGKTVRWSVATSRGGFRH